LANAGDAQTGGAGLMKITATQAPEPALVSIIDIQHL